jgi:hypothetical protein
MGVNAEFAKKTRDEYNEKCIIEALDELSMVMGNSALNRADAIQLLIAINLRKVEDKLRNIGIRTSNEH